LEAIAAGIRCSRTTLIAVDNSNLFTNPAQGECPFAQLILTFGTLGVLQNLTNARLTHIQVSVSLQMNRPDFMD